MPTVYLKTRYLSGGIEPIDAQELRAQNVPNNYILYSSGGGWLTASAIKSYHEPIVTAGRALSSPGKIPIPYIFSTAFFLQFTVDADDAYREFKIPSSFTDSPMVHVHWTKSGDANENGKLVRWRISYTVFTGSNGFIDNPTIAEYEGAYTDTGTTTRKIIRSTDLALSGFVSGYYVGFKVEVVYLVCPASQSLNSPRS